MSNEKEHVGVQASEFPESYLTTIGYIPDPYHVVVEHPEEKKTAAGLVIPEHIVARQSNDLKVMAVGQDSYPLYKPGDTVKVHPNAEATVIIIGERKYAQIQRSYILGKYTS
jgi:co-chaperonin GroES (HSP10)